ncbi:MAG: cyclic nucleotide-binding domain-containing protein [Myxococcales bacterium]|nr:cyclic nucleotide-binding domain-containing protein [Myxococcales bacterium]
MTPEEFDGLALFGQLGAAQRATLAQTLRPRDLDPGDVLFVQGDVADGCYLVLDGAIGVEAEIPGHGIERLATLRRGDLFGEVALLDGGLRSATCAAGPDGARVAELARADFDDLFAAGNPLAHAVMDIVLDRLAQRLRDATQRLVEVAAE